MLHSEKMKYLDSCFASVTMFATHPSSLCPSLDLVVLSAVFKADLIWGHV